MPVVNIAKGGLTTLPAGLGGEFYVHAITVDFSEHNLDRADILRILNVPYGTMVLGIRVDVLAACTLAPGTTVDIGFYKLAADAPDVPDALVNELSLDAVGTLVQPPFKAAAPSESGWIGITPGDGGALSIDDGVVRLFIATMALH